MREVLAVFPVHTVLTCTSLLALLFMCSTHWDGRGHLCLFFSDWDQGGEVWCQHLPLQFVESWSLAERVQHDGPLTNMQSSNETSKMRPSSSCRYFCEA